MIKKDQLRLHIYIDITINHFSVESLCFLCFCVGQSSTKSRGGESEFAAPTRLLVRHCLVVRVGGYGSETVTPSRAPCVSGRPTTAARPL